MTWSAHEIVVVAEGRRLLDSVSLDWKPGRVTAVLGPNGSGKTTLLRVMAGLRQPDQGLVAEGQTKRWTEREWARRVSFVGGGIPETLELSVEEILSSSQYALTGRWGPPEAPLRRQMLSCLERLEVFPGGSESGLERSWATLSAGERQLVDLIRGGLQPTPIWLLDEPTSALDLRHRILVYEWLQEQARLANRVVVFSEHHWFDALSWIDDILVLQRGRVVVAGDRNSVDLETLWERVWRVHREGDRWVKRS